MVIGILFDLTDDPNLESDLFKEYKFPTTTDEKATSHEYYISFQQFFSKYIDNGT